MTLHGPSYPSSTTLEPIPQTFVLSLLCNPETSGPEFKSYDGSQAVVEWSAPSGCYFGSEDPPEGDGNKPEGETEAVGSGMGWFFFLFVRPLLRVMMKANLSLRLFVVFGGYLALGAYYNYTTYGATGVDLIPCVSRHLARVLMLIIDHRHRDFWREVPYMLRDVVSHLCSSFQSRHTSSRGGYISV
jgi:hypothetical protein